MAATATPPNRHNIPPDLTNCTHPPRSRAWPAPTPEGQRIRHHQQHVIWMQASVARMQRSGIRDAPQHPAPRSTRAATQGARLRRAIAQRSCAPTTTGPPPGTAGPTTSCTVTVDADLARLNGSRQARSRKFSSPASLPLRRCWYRPSFSAHSPVVGAALSGEVHPILPVHSPTTGPCADQGRMDPARSRHPSGNTSKPMGESAAGPR